MSDSLSLANEHIGMSLRFAEVTDILAAALTSLYSVTLSASTEPSPPAQ